ncbi:MAG: ATP-binding protein [Candidatus Altiarchaeota archaeon]
MGEMGGDQDDVFQEGRNAYAAYIKKEFTPSYRDWHRKALEFFGGIDRKVDSGGVNAWTEEAFSWSDEEIKFRHSMEASIRQFLEENQGPVGIDFFRRITKSNLPKGAQLLVGISSHRIRDAVTPDRLIEEYNTQLAKYLLGEGERPVFSPPAPEEVEAELIRRASGKLRQEDAVEINESLEDIAFLMKKRASEKGGSINNTGFRGEKTWHESRFIDEVLYELSSNALHFIPKSGGRIDLGGESNKDTATFTVEDNGSGILRENLSKIFKPGWTTRERPDTKGTETGGLGLDLVRGIVEHVFNGRIVVESNGFKYDPQTELVTPSNVTTGTKFTITYPNKPPKEALVV